MDLLAFPNDDAHEIPCPAVAGLLPLGVVDDQGGIAAAESCLRLDKKNLVAGESLRGLGRLSCFAHPWAIDTFFSKPSLFGLWSALFGTEVRHEIQS
jgi:hypothetical protein